MLGLYFSSKLDWGSTFAFAKAASKKIGVLIGSMKFFSFFVALNSLKTLYLNNSTTVPYVDRYI